MMARSIRPIDVITIAGTGNKIGPFDGMTGLVAKKLDSRVFRVSACQYPATIGRVGAAPGAVPYSLDDSVAIAVKDLAWQVRESPNPVGLISYSQGGIAAMRFAEAVARGEFRNANGSPLELAFHVGIANRPATPAIMSFLSRAMGCTPRMVGFLREWSTSSCAIRGTSSVRHRGSRRSGTSFGVCRRMRRCS